MSSWSQVFECPPLPTYSENRRGMKTRGGSFEFGLNFMTKKVSSVSLAYDFFQGKYFGALVFRCVHRQYTISSKILFHSWIRICKSLQAFQLCKMRLINVTWFVTTMEEDDENLFLTLEIHRILVGYPCLRKRWYERQLNAILLKIMALRSEFFYSAQEDTMYKQTSEVSEGRQEPYSKRLPIPLSCLTKAVLSSSNFPPRKSVFRVRLTGNKTKQEMKTGNSSLLCSHNRHKFEYICSSILS